MGNNIPTKLNIRQTILIGFGFMTAMLAWGMYNFYTPRILAGHFINGIPYRIGYFTGDFRLFWANFVMTFDNIAAIFLQPFFGEISDRLESKFGRRTPFLLLGIPIAAGCLFLMPFLHLIPLYIAMFVIFMTLIILFNIAMSFYRAPIVALMPDLTPSKHRSMANVIINAMGGAGTTIGFMIPSLLGALPQVRSQVVGYTTFETQNFMVMDIAIFWTTAIFMFIVLGLFLKFVHEIPTGKRFWHVGAHRIQFDPDTLQQIPVETVVEKKKIRYRTDVEIKGIFSLKEKSAAYMFLAIFFWNAADDAFGTNLSLWGSEYARLPDTALGSLSIVMTIFVIILGLPGAKLSNKKGRLWTLRVGFILFTLAYTGLIIFQEIFRRGHYWVGFIGIMVCLGLKAGGGGFLAIAAITVIWQLAPKDKVGTYTGLYYVFKQSASVLSPLIVGGVLSLLATRINSTDAWVILMPFCLILALLGCLCIYRVKRGEIGDSLTKEELEALEKEYKDDD